MFFIAYLLVSLFNLNLAMPNSLNPDYLSKEDLTFEIISRLEVPTGDSGCLRHQLRNLLKTNVEPVWDDNKFEVKKEVEACLRKWEEWEGVLDDVLSSFPTGKDKARKVSRLLHLQNRLKLVMSCSGSGVEEKVSLKEALDGVAELLFALQSGPRGNTTTSKTCETSVSEVTLSGDISKGGESSSVVEPNIPQLAQFSSDGQLSGTGDAAHVAVASNQHVSELSTTTGTQLSSPLPIPSGTVSHPSSAGFSSMAHYHKLPNPLTPLLQELPVVDGLDVEKLLKFLGTVLRLREFPSLNDYSLLQLIAPYCRGPLAERLTSVLMRQGNLRLFHSEVLEFFIPDRLRERLRLNRFYRPQGPRETLAGYVASIREASKVLMLSMSEREVVQVILDGFNPEERSRLVFANRPSSFTDLDKLCITSRSVQFADEQRRQDNQFRSGRNDRPVMAVQRPVPTPNQGFGTTHRPVTCYKCGETGHIRRNCTKVYQPNTRNAMHSPKNP